MKSILKNLSLVLLGSGLALVVLCILDNLDIINVLFDSDIESIMEIGGIMMVASIGLDRYRLIEEIHRLKK